jgi:UDP-N-acetylmuramoyl-L-alanyl-D-glutamate--2,6-diaminopimelate ligase
MSRNIEEIVRQISINIKGVTSSSKEVKKDFAFVAIKGAIFDGHNYIEEAIKNGASYIIHESEVNSGGSQFFKTENCRKFLSLLAASFYKQQPENIIAVTGTNGKTSTVAFFKQIIENNGKTAATLGTIGLQGMEGVTDFLTTPEVTRIFKILRDAKREGINYFGLEASSHGLHQNRLDGIKFKAVAFTNFSKDHLDYHETMAEYLNAKKYLFSSLAKEGTTAVLNADIPEYAELKSLCKQKNLQILSYGFNGEDLKFIKITAHKASTSLDFTFKGENYSVELNMVGEFQVYNVMCAAGLAAACGINAENIFASLKNLTTVAGRMEKIEYKDVGEIYIDYSHTPDALEKALMTLRTYCQNKLIVAFGCGGDRDTTKRSEMGAIATKYADLTIITDDNPRTEDPIQIRNDIKAKLDPRTYTEIAPREEAIKFGLKSMQVGDIFLIAGKGHEDYQIIGKTKFPFNEKEIVKNYLVNSVL